MQLVAQSNGALAQLACNVTVAGLLSSMQGVGAADDLVLPPGDTPATQGALAAAFTCTMPSTTQMAISWRVATPGTADVLTYLVRDVFASVLGSVLPCDSSATLTGSVLGGQTLVCGKDGVDDSAGIVHAAAMCCPPPPPFPPAPPPTPEPGTAAYLPSWFDDYLFGNADDNYETFGLNGYRMQMYFTSSLLGLSLPGDGPTVIKQIGFRLSMAENVTAPSDDLVWEAGDFVITMGYAQAPDNIGAVFDNNWQDSGPGARTKVYADRLVVPKDQFTPSNQQNGQVFVTWLLFDTPFVYLPGQHLIIEIAHQPRTSGSSLVNLDAGTADYGQSWQALGAGSFNATIASRKDLPVPVIKLGW